MSIRQLEICWEKNHLSRSFGRNEIHIKALRQTHNGAKSIFGLLAREYLLRVLRELSLCYTFGHYFSLASHFEESPVGQQILICQKNMWAEGTLLDNMFLVTKSPEGQQTDTDNKKQGRQESGCYKTSGRHWVAPGGTLLTYSMRGPFKKQAIKQR
jgi:hypothetical protein